MVAVFDVTYDNLGADDAPGATSVVTNLRFNAEDTNDQDLASPRIIPAPTATIFSFWKQIYLLCSTAPDSQVNNIIIYTDGALDWGTGVVVQVGDGTQVKNSGASTGYDVADAQEDMTNHSDVAAKTSLFTFTSGSGRAVTISETLGVIDAIGETSDYIVLQTDVESTASPGTKPTEDVTWQYDEI